MHNLSKFQVRKRDEFGFRIIRRDFVMVVNGVSDHPWSLSRVTGKNPVPGKHWYIFTSSLCGVKPNKFAKNEIFRRFPEEIRSLPPADLKPAKRGCSATCSQPNSLLSLRLVFSLHYFDSEILPPIGSWDRLYYSCYECSESNRSRRL